jgi:uncharacterized membrane protein
MAHEREAGVDRIIAFSDGVVAIAITLLILPLTEIDRAEDATLANVVADNQSALFAFALSFAVIANYWTIHHAILRPLRRHNSRFVALNMLWLAPDRLPTVSHCLDRRRCPGRIRLFVYRRLTCHLGPQPGPR